MPVVGATVVPTPGAGGTADGHPACMDPGVGLGWLLLVQGDFKQTHRTLQEPERCRPWSRCGRSANTESPSPWPTPW